MASSKIFNGESEGFGTRNHSLDKPKVIDASHILKHPHRANRPDHIVIILRGLPGSCFYGKVIHLINITVSIFSNLFFLSFSYYV